MSIVQTDKIDFIGIEKKSNNVILTISDHLDWSEPKKHLFLLQEKLNNYIVFFESGQIEEIYPKSKGKKLVIEIIGQNPLSEDGTIFLAKVTQIIKPLGVTLKFKLFEE